MRSRKVISQRRGISILLVHEDVHGGVQVLVAAEAALQELQPHERHPAAVLVAALAGRARRRRDHPHRGPPQDRRPLLPRRRLYDEAEPDELAGARGRRHWRRGGGAQPLLEVEEARRSWDHAVCFARICLSWSQRFFDQASLSRRDSQTDEDIAREE